MNKNILLLLFVLLWASPALAVQTTETAGADARLVGFDLGLHGGYRLVNHTGSPRAAEYENDQSSFAGYVTLEYDPLPQRVVLEYYQLNRKDYFGTFDYAYGDIVILNALSRSVFHNLDHMTFGADDPATTSPSSIDFNPTDQYSLENTINKAFIRFKVPDFPFHLYAEEINIVRKGDIQQRFMRAFTGELNRASASRDVVWRSNEVKMGVNSHAGPVELDYSHTQKEFTATGDKVMTDTLTDPTRLVTHNLVPDLTSTTDTVKIHTSYTGGIVASGTLSTGENKNTDSKASSVFRNAGGDLSFTPMTNLSMFVKYRRFGLSMDTPDVVEGYNVRNSIASKRNVLSGMVRYRPTDSLTVKAEYSWEDVLRDVTSGSYFISAPPTDAPNFWEVGHHTTKNTARLSGAYRLSSKFSVRANYSHQEVFNPAYDTDPTRSDSARMSLTWVPVRWITVLLGYGGTNETRSKLDPPLANGTRDASRNDGLASMTMLIGKRTSITPSYAYFHYKVKQSFTFADTLSVESGVPYADTAHVASISATHAASDSVNLFAEASMVFSRGNFTSSSGIASFSNEKAVESIYTAAIETQHTKAVGSEIRYQYRKYDDQIDNTLDGKVETIVATLSMKW